jgi:hypothetical protein
MNERFPILDGENLGFNEKVSVRAENKAKKSAERAPGKRPNGGKKSAQLVSEDSAALDFAELYRGKLLYDHDAGAWYEWTGYYWKREGTGLALEEAYPSDSGRSIGS